MPNLLLHIDDQMAKSLDRVAPARQKSRFIRLAIQAAIMHLDDLKTREAYERAPDKEPEIFMPETWDSKGWDKPRRSAKRAQRK